MMLFTKGLRKSFRIAILCSSHHSLHILRHSCLQLQILTFSALLHRLRQGHDWWFLSVRYLLPQVDLSAPANKNLTMLWTILKNPLPRRSCCSGCCALGPPPLGSSKLVRPSVDARPDLVSHSPIRPDLVHERSKEPHSYSCLQAYYYINLSYFLTSAEDCEPGPT